VDLVEQLLLARRQRHGSPDPDAVMTIGPCSGTSAIGNPSREILDVLDTWICNIRLQAHPAH
jgi:hypothetical protein